MNITAAGKLCWLVVGVLVVWPLAGVEALAARPYDVEVLLEGGVAYPYGDLGDDYFATIKGVGAETGYEIGARVRYFVTPRWALAPSFHFVDFGNFSTITEETGGLEISPTVLRYGMDLQYFLPARHRALRPFFSAGAALSRNRFRQDIESDPEYGGDPSFFETAINALSGSVGAGLRLGDFEWSVIYHVNRFKTMRLSASGLKEDYSWDYLVIRAGFAFPAR